MMNKMQRISVDFFDVIGLIQDLIYINFFAKSNKSDAFPIWQNASSNQV